MEGAVDRIRKKAIERRKEGNDPRQGLRPEKGATGVGDDTIGGKRNRVE